MDVHTPQMQQHSDTLDVTRLTLMSIPADQSFIRQLYRMGHIQEYAKFLGSRFINKQYTWGFILSLFCQVFGFALLTVGAIIFFQQKWPLQSYLYQSLSIELMLLFSIWNASRQGSTTCAGQVFIGLGLLLSAAGIGHLFYFQHATLSLMHLLQVGLFFTLPWLILLQQTYRYALFAIIISSLTILGVMYATI